jgi:hypothetical protein
LPPQKFRMSKGRIMFEKFGFTKNILLMIRLSEG